MKHRVWTFALVLTLCAALLTAGAMAAEESSVVEDMIEVLPTGSVAVNEKNFPDEVFRELVNKNCAGGDYVLSPEEIAAVTRIGDTSYKGISDFKGLEYFTELKYFGCAGNNLTHLDVSANTKLVELFASYNDLTALDVSKNTELVDLSCDSNELTSLDVSKNTKLEMLEASDNNLTSIDVSNNTALRALSCGYNQIGALDVSKNTALESLGCMSNKLTALDVSKNTALEYLYCGENYLTRLDVSGNPNLEVLDCSHCAIGTLDLSNNPAIVRLNAAAFGGQTLDISGNPNLLAVYNSGEVNPYDGEPGVVSLMMDDPDDMGTIELRYSEGVTIQTGADGGDSGDAGEEPAGVMIDETNFPDETFRQYIRENIDTDGTETLSEAEIAAAKVIDLSTTGVYDLTGLAYFTALEELYCTQHSMTTLNVSANKALVVLKCGLGNLFELNVSGNAALEVLECYNNQLTMLDVSGCPALTKLDCEYNDLCYLDVSTNENLTTLSCANNEIRSLDIFGNENMIRAYTEGVCEDFGADGLWYAVYGENEYGDEIVVLSLGVDASTEVYTGEDSGDSGNSGEEPAGVKIETAFPDEAFRTYVSENFDTDSDGYLSDEEIAGVTEIRCQEMGITSIKGVEIFTGLLNLYCAENAITELDVSALTKLERLYAWNNELTEIDVSSNKKLLCLDLSSNRITSVDVSMLSELIYLDVQRNFELAELDIRSNTKLQDLYVGKTALTELDISKNPDMAILYAGYTSIGELDLSDKENLWVLSINGLPMTEVDISGAPLLIRVLREGMKVTDGTYTLMLDEYREGLFQYDEDVLTIKGLPALPGDTDGDGKVEPKDLTRLMKSILKVEGAEVSVEAGDLNGDDVVDILDIIRLVRQLAGVDTTV